MAIGDNHNDLEMLEFAGVAVVMGNASNEFKQNGWMVTGSNEESGVAQAVERFWGWLSAANWARIGMVL